jgi:predicted RNA polymerase sigma factor
LTGAALVDVVAADPRPTSRPERAIEVQELYATIAQLPEDFRLALVAVDVLGLSYREAARALKVREATITTRLFRARGQVARALDPELARDTQSTPRDDAHAPALTAQSPAIEARAARAEQAGRGEQAGHSEQAGREETRARGVLPSRSTS